MSGTLDVRQAAPPHGKQPHCRRGRLYLVSALNMLSNNGGGAGRAQRVRKILWGEKLGEASQFVPTGSVVGEEDARQLLSLGRTAVLGTGDPQGKGNAVVLCQRLLRGALLPSTCPPPAVPCRREQREPDDAALPQHSPSFHPGRPGNIKDTSPCLPAQPQHSVCPSTGQGAAHAPPAEKPLHSKTMVSGRLV